MNLAPGAKAEVLISSDKIHWSLPVDADPWFWDGIELTLAFHPKTGELYLGWNTNIGMAQSPTGQVLPRSFEIFKVNLTQKTLIPIFKVTAPGASKGEGGYAVGRFAFDENGQVLLGWNDIRRYSLAGKQDPTFAVTPLPVIGESVYYPARVFKGTVTLTRNAIWLTSRPGSLGRFTRDMTANPGLVTKENFALSCVTQIIDGPNDSYYIKSDDALYQARIENNKLVLLQRFGALPHADSLALTASGFIGVGNSEITSGMLWFPFNGQSASTAPIRAEGPGPIAQGFVHGYPDGDIGLLSFSYDDAMKRGAYTPHQTTIGLRKFLPQADGVDYWPEPRQMFWRGNCSGRLSAITRVGNILIGIDAEHNRLVGAENTQYEMATIEGIAPIKNKLTALATPDAHTLLYTEGDSIHACAINNGVVHEIWQLNNFGAGKEQQFGNELYLSYSQHRLLVADSTRQRVLLFAYTGDKQQPLTFLCQIGETDKAGDDKAHFATPTLVSMSAKRAVVYDSLNQRVVKLSLQ